MLRRLMLAGPSGPPPGVVVTWNPSDIGANLVLSEGNLRLSKPTGGNGYTSTRATIPVVGKKYWEILVGPTGGSPYIMIGVATAAMPLSSSVGATANGWAYYEETGQKWNSNVGAAYGATYTFDDVIGVVFDSVTGQLEFYKNGVSQGVAFTGISGAVYPAVSLWRAPEHTVRARFKASEFTYPIPSGATALGI